MKISITVLTACVEIALGASTAAARQLHRRQGVFDLAGLATNLIVPAPPKGFGKVDAPPGSASIQEVMNSPVKIEGVNVKRVKIRIGPYKVPGMSMKSPSGHAGMLENVIDRAVPKPCAGDCLIFRQVAGLEYLNGSNANIDSGMWLHHMISFNEGPQRWDPVGKSATMCMPHIYIGSTASRSERYFVSGNERSPVPYYEPASGLKTAYHLKAADKFITLSELMNMNMEAQTVWVTLTYDVSEGPVPQGFQDTKVVWLDASSCQDSEVEPPKENGSFMIGSKPWTPNFEGKIISSGGHLHDGGISLELNTGSEGIHCLTNASYSESPEFINKRPPMGADVVATDHISSMPGCETSGHKVKELKKSQSWTLNAQYDYDKRQGNLEAGKQAEIMAIALVVVAVPPTGGPQAAVRALASDKHISGVPGPAAMRSARKTRRVARR